ncbi:MAG: class I SAM-dependent methyltransferase [Chloroflexota bacterium]|nr:class I SAM-dependent methyltransferase [Chloroflexota bacterium]
MATVTLDPVGYKQTTREQWQQAADAWHRWGPTIEAWLGESTRVMLNLAQIGPGDRVLDLATGAGEPALTIAERVGPTGHVLATDIAPNILAFAARAAADRGLTNLETRVMDGERLEVPDESFDVVTSRVGLIYFPDQQGALAETRRVLKPGGRVAAIVYTTPERNPFFSIPVGIIRRRANLPPPAPGQPGPFSLGGEGVLAAAFERAGFQEVRTAIVPSPLRLASAAECVRFERESFGALHQMLSGLVEPEREAAWDEIARELARFEGPDGFAGPCEMIVGVGTKQG